MIVVQYRNERFHQYLLVLRVRGNHGPLRWGEILEGGVLRGGCIRTHLCGIKVFHTKLTTRIFKGSTANFWSLHHFCS